MDVFYNEWDKTAAQWMRNLIAAGQLPKGQVSQDDIRTLTGQSIPVGTKQAHFFAGIGGWAHALQLAGWPDDREVWTASCPCQPFSCAGKQQGFSDERDLWPDTFRIIAERKPETVFGEQVASKDGLLWLDRVYADLEGAGYAVAAFDLCAAGISAPHIRQRLYWMARRESCDRGLSVRQEQEKNIKSCGSGKAGGRMADCISEQADKKQQRPQDHERGGTPNLLSGCGVDSGILHPVHQGLEGQRGHGDGGNEPGWLDKEANGPATPPSGGHDGMGISQSVGRKSWGPESGRPFDPDATSSQGNGVPNGPGNRFARIETPSGEGGDRRIESRCGTDAWGGAVIGRWQDGTARRFEPGILPLAYGVPGRVGQIRGYGNAIVPPLAAEFVRAAMDALEIFSGCDVVSRIKPVEDSDAD